VGRVGDVAEPERNEPGNRNRRRKGQTVLETTPAHQVHAPKERADKECSQPAQDRDPPPQGSLRCSERREKSHIAGTKATTGKPRDPPPRQPRREATDDGCDYHAHGVRRAHPNDKDLTYGQRIHQWARNTPGANVDDCARHAGRRRERLGSLSAERWRCQRQERSHEQRDHRPPAAPERCVPAGAPSASEGGPLERDEHDRRRSAAERKGDELMGHTTPSALRSEELTSRQGTPPSVTAMDAAAPEARDLPKPVSPSLWNLRVVVAPLRGGAEIVPGRLLRSEAPYYLDQRSRHRLVSELGITRVLDLRTAAERGADEELGVQRTWLPLPDVSRDPRLLAGEGTLVDAYRAMVDDHAQTLAEAIRALVEATDETGSVLVHCTAGKDRTGLVIALLLEVLGAPRDVIAQDYAESGANLERLAARLRAAGSEPPWSALPRTILSSPPQAILTALDHVRERFGSTAAMLAAFDVRAVELQRLRSALTRPRSP